MPKNDQKKIDANKENCLKFYKKAFELSNVGFGFKRPLEPYNSTRLSINLHFGNFYFEVMNEPQEAVTLGENAIKECMALMEEMPEEKFSEVSNLCELIKENILVWSGKDKKE